MKTAIAVLAAVLIIMTLFAAGMFIYDFAWQSGANSAAFAIRVEQVIPEPDNTYTVLIGYEDNYYFHSCKK